MAKNLLPPSQALASENRRIQRHEIGGGRGGRMMAPMTRARTASSGMGSLAAIQPLLAAVLMLCVSLVQAAATTLRMILNRKPRDWHTGPLQEGLPQATSGPQSQGTSTPHGVMLGPVPSISVRPTRGFAVDPCDTDNRDSRDKPENDSVDSAAARANPAPPARGRRNTHACRNKRNQVGVCRHRRGPRRHALS